MNGNVAKWAGRAELAGRMNQGDGGGGIWRSFFFSFFWGTTSHTHTHTPKLLAPLEPVRTEAPPPGKRCAALWQMPSLGVASRFSPSDTSLIMQHAVAPTCPFDVRRLSPGFPARLSASSCYFKRSLFYAWFFVCVLIDERGLFKTINRVSHRTGASDRKSIYYDKRCNKWMHKEVSLTFTHILSKGKVSDLLLLSTLWPNILFYWLWMSDMFT